MKAAISYFTLMVAVGVMTTPTSAQHAHHDHRMTAVADPGLSEQIEAVRRGTERYLDHANAVKDGYKLFGAEGPLMGEHWYHPDLVKKTALELTRPATLQYALVAGKRTLVGVAYNLYQRPGEPLPEGFAGSSDEWHVHDVPKMAKAFVADRPFLRWIVDRRTERGKIGAGDHRSRLVMVHAWIWSENPDGVFAQQHRGLPYLRAALPAEWAQAGDADAAWGLSLARDGCSFELRRLDKLARLSVSQKQSLREGCERAAAVVRSALASEMAPNVLNRAAGDTWREFTTLRDRTLTAEQKRRLDSVIEPMHPHTM